MNKIIVRQNSLHGGETLYVGESERQAIKIARKYDCHDCRCGGPTIKQGVEQLIDWETTPAYQPAKKPTWIKEVN